MRRRRTLALVLLVVLVGLLLADAVLRLRVEALVADRIEGEVGGAAAADLEGWPFAVRVATGLPQVRIRVVDAALPAGGRVDGLQVLLTGARLPPATLLDALTGSTAVVEADDGAFEARVSTATLNALAREETGLDLQVVLRPGTAVIARGPLRVEAQVRVRDGELVVAPAGQPEPEVLLRVPLDGLPEGVVPRRVELRAGTAVLRGGVDRLVLRPPSG